MCFVLTDFLGFGPTISSIFLYNSLPQNLLYETAQPLTFYLCSQSALQHQFILGIWLSESPTDSSAGVISFSRLISIPYCSVIHATLRRKVIWALGFYLSFIMKLFPDSMFQKYKGRIPSNSILYVYK